MLDLYPNITFVSSLKISLDVAMILLFLLRRLGLPYFANVQIVVMKCNFSRELFIAWEGIFMDY